MGRILVPDLCREGSFVGPTSQQKTNQKKAMLNLNVKAGPPAASGSPPAEGLSPAAGFLVLAVVLGREIFEGGKAVAAGHVLLELLLQGFETDAVLLVGPELGDVEAGGVRHVDHVRVGQHDEFILLQADESSVSTCQALGDVMRNTRAVPQ